jgi:hypothetical protein
MDGARTRIMLLIDVHLNNIHRQKFIKCSTNHFKEDDLHLASHHFSEYFMCLYATE